MSLPDEVRAQYITIIDAILGAADLTTISVKQVRNGIQEKVEYDITPHKTTINELVHSRFNIAEAKRTVNGVEVEQPVPSVETPDTTTKLEHPTNGVHKSSDESPQSFSQPSSTTAKRETSSDQLSDVIDEKPPKKKRKAGTEDDAVLAARLQAELNSIARPTRGGPKPMKPAKKKSPKKKSHAKVDGTDDSEIDEKPKKPKNTGFHKPLNLSTPLSNLLNGEVQLSRPEVTKRLWAYIKANDLQEPSDKRYIRCDDRMREVFKQDRVHMFTMTKLVSQQMYNPDE